MLGAGVFSFINGLKKKTPVDKHVNWIICHVMGRTEGVLVMAAGLTFMVATPLLSIGWYLIGLVSARYPARYIIPQAERAHKARMERKAQASNNDSG